MPSLFYILIGKIFALLVGWYYFRYLPRPYKLVLLVIAIAAIFESCGYYVSSHLHEPNSWLFNLYILVDVWLMGTAAVYLIETSLLKKVFVALIVIDSILWVTEVTANSFYKFANLAMVSGLIILTIIYLTVLFSNSVFSAKGIFKQPVFWLSASTILYCACDIPYMGLHNYLIVHAPGLSMKLFYINIILDAIRYPLVAISFILLGRQKQVALNAA